MRSSSEDLRVYMRMHMRVGLMYRGESKGLPAAARAQSVASERDYLCQKLAGINLMHLYNRED